MKRDRLLTSGPAREILIGITKAVCKKNDKSFGGEIEVTLRER